MKEIGGYIELELNRGYMLHEDGILLNCGRNALAYLLHARRIKRIWLPYFLCDSVFNVCKQHEVEIRYYHIDDRWIPQSIHLEGSDWLYIVNYYGQMNKYQLIIKGDELEIAYYDYQEIRLNGHVKVIEYENRI